MKTIVKMQFGSHVYGTNLPTSDTDYRGVHLPDARDILLQRVKPAISEKTKKDEHAKNTADDVDFESFSLQQYMRLLLEGQTIALDMLFTPSKWIIESSDAWGEIVNQEHLWLHRGVNAFVGYCRTQAAKYGVRGFRVAAVREANEMLDGIIAKHGPQTKLRDVWGVIQEFAMEDREGVDLVTTPVKNDPTRSIRYLEVCNRKVDENASAKYAREIFGRVFEEYGQRALAAENNQGVDWKATMHAVRAAHQAEELLTTHKMTFPRPEADLLVKIRRGELPYKEVAEMIESGIERVEAAAKVSGLPDKPNFGEAEELVRAWYENEVVGDGLEFLYGKPQT